MDKHGVCLGRERRQAWRRAPMSPEVSARLASLRRGGQKARPVSAKLTVQWEILPAALGDDILVSGTVGEATFELLVPWRAHSEGCNVAACLRCGTSSLIGPFFGQWQRAGARVATGASLQCPVFRPQLASSADLTFVCECTRVRKVRDRAARTGGKGVIGMLKILKDTCRHGHGEPRRSGRPRLKPSSKRSCNIYMPLIALGGG